MKRVELGNTGIYVSRLCFGSLTMTPFQANLSVKEGASLIEYAYKKGINFIDTAEIYDNYAYIREGIKNIDRKDYVITTKTYAYTRDMAKDSLDKALKELDTDYIDIFLLHEQESIHTVRGHYEALEYFMEAKKEGKIRALGLSTHRIEGVKAVRDLEELEIVHPIVNKDGIGIHDGNIEEMEKLLIELEKMGKGIYSMKPLGGGHLIKDFEESLKYVKGLNQIHSIAIGMQSKEEIDANISIMSDGSVEDDIKEKLEIKNRKLIVADYCIACGKCEERCQQDGIKIIEGKAVPNENCILCGYCATVCPEFCIKVI